MSLSNLSERLTQFVAGESLPLYKVLKKRVNLVLSRCVIKGEDDEEVMSEKGNQILALFSPEIGA